MTEQKAIKNLKHLFSEYELGLPNTDSLETLQLVISALEEIQQYRKLGTVEELKEAREKQTSIDRELINGEYFCPRCKYIMRRPGYCRNCGQHTY